MPRSVKIAIVAASTLGLLGLVSVPILIADVVSDDAGTRWVSTAFGVREGSLRYVFHGMYLIALPVIPAAFRRNGRELALQGALGAAILLGFFALGASAMMVIQRRIDGMLVALVLIFGLVTALAWALSRPSAKAWFTPRAS